MNRPNVLLISVDHWAAKLLGCMGDNNILTPTINQLARDGILYTNMYSECPVCIPARRSLMTGLSPKNHGDRVFSDTMPMPSDVPTLAQTFRNAGYQAYAVGKLHVYPQRDRIGFDDVILQEEGRYEFGLVDDYQIWLGEQGYTGEEYLHGMGNNTYNTRPWHLPEYTHPTNWATYQMLKTMKRKDPTKPSFYYISYQFPHPPLVPLDSYLKMYEDVEFEEPILGDWIDDSFIMKSLTSSSTQYSKREINMAKRAFYAQCTHIDHQIRLLIGNLREMNILDNTVIGFFSDHGDMLFDHNMVGKRNFYEKSTNIPFVLSGKVVEKRRGEVDDRLGCLSDVMPTLLDICDIEPTKKLDGISLWSYKKREYLYGEVGEGDKATRMIHNGRFKLIYYPTGNILQLFDLENDPNELKNLYGNKEYKKIYDILMNLLIKNLYGDDIKWIKDNTLVGVEAPEYKTKSDYTLYNQRGLHWPTPSGYTTIGKNA